MSYTSITTPIPGLSAGEQALQLDTGETVAISYQVLRVDTTNGNAIAARVRQIDPLTGITVMDSHGVAVCVAHTYNADPAHIDRYTLNVLIRETLFAVLGEPLTMDPEVTPPVSILGIDPVAIPNVSIRHAIAAAAAATQQGAFTPAILPPSEPAPAQ